MVNVSSTYLNQHTGLCVTCSIAFFLKSNTDAGEMPRRKHTTFRSWRKFEIKNSPQWFEESHCLQFRGQTVKRVDCLTLKMKTLSFKMSCTSLPSTWCHIHDDLHLQKHHIENFRSLETKSIHLLRQNKKKDITKLNMVLRALFW